jgi:hypothetical protein
LTKSKASFQVFSRNFESIWRVKGLSMDQQVYLSIENCQRIAPVNRFSHIIKKEDRKQLLGNLSWYSFVLDRRFVLTVFSHYHFCAHRVNSVGQWQWL